MLTEPTRKTAVERFKSVARFDTDVDLEGYIRDCPSDATTLGTFFRHICDGTPVATDATRERLFAGLSQRSWVAFKSYPLVDFMRLAHNAASLISGVRTGEGLRRIGWLAFPSFAATMAGRVVLYALGNTLEDVLRTSPQAYRHSVRPSNVSVSRKGDRHFELEFRDLHSFVDTYQCGVVEGAVLAFNHCP